MKIPTSLLLALALLPLAALSEPPKGGEAEARGMFVFGSSLVDNGNNNFIKNATTKANFPPYGIDSPLGPSGRFSNGRNMIDALGKLLRLPSLIPPFNDPTTAGDRIVHGVNFASGGSGILDQTGGSLTGEVMSMNQQIGHFKAATLPALRAQPSVGTDLSHYLFVIGVGGNDYLRYFVSGERATVSVPEFTSHLFHNLTAQIKELYDVGARKFVLFSAQAIGCYPVVRAGKASCVEPVNDAALLFNSRLRELAGSPAEGQMPGSKMVFVDSYKIIRDIINKPEDNGFVDTSSPCCEVLSAAEGGNGVICRKNGRACGVRATHVFFDGLHPTEAVNVRIARKAYSSELEEEAYPTNVKQLASLQI